MFLITASIDNTKNWMIYGVKRYTGPIWTNSTLDREWTGKGQGKECLYVPYYNLN